MKTVKIFFDEPKPFELGNIKPLGGIIGLYFIFLPRTEIQYPFKKSRLIYIGMSEKRTNSIGKRLSDHYDGSSGNPGLVNYRKVESLRFTYINFEMLKNVWQHRIEDLESYFILDFVKQYGVYPICNNKTGFEILKSDLEVTLDIDWSYFEKGEKNE
jgi:hypothetical protein